MSSYNTDEWKEFRDNVIESDGFKCTSCFRSEDEVILQVHHKIYIKGKFPWVYGSEHCVTLCKGCHAAEHGILQPKIGWEFIGQEDSGEFNGTCENSKCGATIRHKYLISHPNWRFLEVGTVCCDNLTDSEIASNRKEAMNRYKSRKARFLKSKRWKNSEFSFKLKQSLFEIEISHQEEGIYNLTIHNLKSKKEYLSLDDAKSAAFDVIESGDLYKYLDEKGIKYPRKKEKRTDDKIE